MWLSSPGLPAQCQGSLVGSSYVVTSSSCPLLTSSSLTVRACSTSRQEARSRGQGQGQEVMVRGLRDAGGGLTVVKLQDKVRTSTLLGNLDSSL